ncbi:hypothetical protein ACFWIA_16240 [Streptomyces sp. NPDC127068]|uniref:hypothetical protein n=1 Tax=Streptomyces sp. NPDC127068 TaxID=3347127 RepID=UPI00366364AC
MRNLIAHALIWVLHLFFPPRGQHRAPTPPRPEAAPDRIDVALWGLRDAFERLPGHDPDLPEIPPFRPLFVELSERLAPGKWEQTQQRERRIAAAAVTYGGEYPYTYPTALRSVPAPATDAEVSA